MVITVQIISVVTDGIVQKSIRTKCQRTTKVLCIVLCNVQKNVFFTEGHIWGYQYPRGLAENVSAWRGLHQRTPDRDKSAQPEHRLRGSWSLILWDRWPLDPLVAGSSPAGPIPYPVSCRPNRDNLHTDSVPLFAFTALSS